MTTQIGREALTPNLRLAPFSPFIGVWNTVGTHTMMPGIALRGRTVFEWHESGAFVCVRSEIDEPEIPSGIALIGSDDHSDEFTMLYFDERNVSRRFELSIDGMVMRWSRIVSGFSQRSVVTISPDGKTMRAESALCQADVNWERDLTLDYTRVG